MAWANPTSGDLCSARSAGAATCSHPELVLATCILASSLAFIDGSVVNVGLPAIGHSLGADAAELQWIINAYLLPLSALLLLGGALGDHFGRRRMLVLGVGIFGIASVLCAVAPGLGWMLAARALQGAGAAILLPNSLAILGAAFSGEARGRAIGTWSAASSAAAAIGPVFGGWLIDTFGWRQIFLINVPFALAAIGLAMAYVREPINTSKSNLDITGAVVITSALGALTWGLTIGTGRSGWSVYAVSAVLIGSALLLAFLWIEKRRGDDAMVPLALFNTREFVGLTALTLLLYGALGALLVLVPYLVIQGSGFSATAAGAALLPFPIVLMLASRAMGGIAARAGARIPLTAGPLIVAAGFLLLLRVNAGASYWTGVFPALLVMSLGMAGAVAPLTTAVLSSVDPAHTGSASGLNSAVARAGGLIATALLGFVFSASGTGLFAAFHLAALACAIACLGAGASAFVFLRRRPLSRVQASG